ncbi:MAG: alpha/beta fold hydrolase [Nocardiaceae bacterium]|nr:alpha/beta fold hydrolase [Nocardiaceae bacterium]
MTIDFTPDPALYPFESRWFDSSAGRLHYVDEGTGPAIVMFHGNPAWSFLYRDIIVALRDRFRCIAIDYLGFGLSDHPNNYGYSAAEHANTAGELLDKLDLRDFIVFGHDWGGPIGLHAAAARAGDVRGLILGNTWFWPTDTKLLRTYGRVLSLPPLQFAIRARTTFADQLILRTTATKLDDAIMAHYRKPLPTPASRRAVAEFPRQLIAARRFLGQLAQDVPAKLGSKPTLLVWGMKDLAFRPSMLIRMQGVFPNHTTVPLPDAKHYIQEDAPEAIAEAIISVFG